MGPISKPIADAIQALSDHARKYADIGAWDLAATVTEQDRAARKAAVESVCDEMDALAQRAAVERVHYRDFDAVWDKLNALGAAVPHDQIVAVTMAFRIANRM